MKIIAKNGKNENSIRNSLNAPPTGKRAKKRKKIDDEKKPFGDA